MNICSICGSRQRIEEEKGVKLCHKCRAPDKAKKPKPEKAKKPKPVKLQEPEEEHVEEEDEVELLEPEPVHEDEEQLESGREVEE